MTRFFMATAALLLSMGCMSKLEEQTKATGSTVLFKKTQDVTEYKAEEKKKVSDSKVVVDNPVTGALQAYRPMIEQTSKLQIEHALNLFNATEGRYPKDHAEFMSKIIKENNLSLPVLHGKSKYQYDVANHELKIVEDK